MIEWTEEFGTGSDAIDQQHLTLIDAINHLEWFLAETNPTRETFDFMSQLVGYLESYAETHFRFEEGCMERYRCPVHAANKEAHKVFSRFIQQFKENIRHKGIRPDALRSLHQTMSRWIQEHILRVDTQLKPCLKAAG